MAPNSLKGAPALAPAAAAHKEAVVDGEEEGEDLLLSPTSNVTPFRVVSLRLDNV